MNRYKNIVIWKRSVALATKIYEVTQKFPKEEKYGLTSQIRRCAISMSSNIAEGAGRSTDKDFNRFLSIAYGSSYELETQIIIATNLEFISCSASISLCNEIDEIQKMIYSFSKNLITRSSWLAQFTQNSELKTQNSPIAAKACVLQREKSFPQRESAAPFGMNR